MAGAKDRKPPTARLTRRSPMGKTPTPSERGYIQVQLAFPTVYQNIIDKEAEILGIRRAQFLEYLVKRKDGSFPLSRRANAPTHKIPRDLGEPGRYIWHCRAEVKESFDEMRLRLGNIPPTNWFILALNEWLGLPAF
jgi:hypothetical protein